MNPFYHSSAPLVSGSLHRLTEEHDNCGMGAIAHLQGERSHRILDYALTSVCCMTHRGAVDADMKTGDGSGVLTQIPYPLFRKAAAKLGHEVKNDADLAVAVFFFPAGDAVQTESIKSLTAEVTDKRGIERIGWREVPVDVEALGKIAKTSKPQIEHLLMTRPEGMDAETFERQLYLCRREIEHRTKDIKGFYMPSFSSRLISYKALAMPAALRAFYLDFADPDYQVAIALYHQRFSTNTFPAWPLGQPFRMMCHNGEINTVEGNRNWMTSREEFFASPSLGGRHRAGEKPDPPWRVGLRLAGPCAGVAHSIRQIAGARHVHAGSARLPQRRGDFQRTPRLLSIHPLVLRTMGRTRRTGLHRRHQTLCIA